MSLPPAVWDLITPLSGWDFDFLSGLMGEKKKSFWLLVILGILIFSAYIPINSKGAGDDHELARNSVDENFQYPFLIHMITPGETAAETRWRLISYAHYIYGYPFYVASALVAAPVQLKYAENTELQVQSIVLLERQFVSVLPMLLAIGIFTYLTTRFRSPWIAAAVFLLLCTIPGIVRQNIWWWHPDALAILSTALTFLFLDRDNDRFGKNFYLAAIFCGLAISIKTIGIFFAPVIAYLLITALIQKTLSWQHAILAGSGFLAIITAVIFLTNPLMFIPSALERIIQVRVDHNHFFTHGWADDDPYAVGWVAWQPVLNGWYGPFTFLAFAFTTHIFNALHGEIARVSRLFLAWIIPFSLYIIYIIAIKPDHYWMPVMLPLFAGVIPSVSSLWQVFIAKRKEISGKTMFYLSCALASTWMLFNQFVFHITVIQDLLKNYIKY